MRYVLAVAVLGASLSFAATAALADDPHEGLTPSVEANPQVIVAQDDSTPPTVAGANAGQQMWSDRAERGDTR